MSPENQMKMILPMKGIGSTQKIILIDVLLNSKDAIFKASVVYTRLQLERQRFNKQLQELVRKGYVIRHDRYSYSLDLDPLQFEADIELTCSDQFKKEYKNIF